MTTRGRPKGAVTNAIGLPLQRKRAKITKRPRPFKNRTIKDRAEIILSWFVSSEGMKNFKKNILIGEEEIQVDIQDIPSAAKDSNVDINMIRKFFSPDGWTAVTTLFKDRQKLPFYCKTCFIDADQDGRETIFCDSSCEWIHFTCANLNDRPTTNYWYCNECK